MSGKQSCTVMAMALLMASAAAQMPTSTTLSTSETSVLLGQQVTLTATVMPISAPGKVTFYDGVTVLGVAELVSGRAIFKTAMLGFGSHALYGRYRASGSFQKSTSAVVPLRVNAVPGSGFAAAPPCPHAYDCPGRSVLFGYEGSETTLIRDFNRDAKPDVVIAGNSTNPRFNGGWLQVLLGSGNGALQQSWFSRVPGSAILSDDWNGDGNIDLLVNANYALWLYSGVGDGTFTPGPQITMPDTFAFAVADLNEDGVADLAGAQFRSGSNSVAVALGTGDGTFRPAVYYALPSFRQRSVHVADFNGDGKPDVAADDGNTSIDVLLGNGDGTLQAPVSSSLGTLSGLRIGDLNRDGKADLVYLNPGGLSVALGNGDGTFKNAVLYAVPGNLRGVHIVDFNGDGTVDLVAEPASGGMQVLPGNGDGTFRAPVQYGADYPEGADFNGDGIADTVAIEVVPWTQNDRATTVRIKLGVRASSVILSVTRGSGQTSAVGQPFGTALEVQLKDANGQAGSGAPVAFSAPASGASGTFPGGREAVVYTNALGLATAPLFTANTIAGTYRVAATAPGALPAEFTLTNQVIPTSDSVMPNAGTGMSGVFTFRYSHGSGYAYLRQVFASFSDSAFGMNACIVYYLRDDNGIYLKNDGGNGWLGPVTPGTPGSLMNSRCTLNAAASSVAGSGNTLAVMVSLAFKPVFAGVKGIYVYAIDSAGLTTPTFEQRGSWTVIDSGPTNDSVAPASGSGMSGVFAFQYSSASGYAHLWQVFGALNETAFGRQGCNVYYLRDNNGLYLKNDTDDGWLGPLTPGVAGNMTNSRCTLDAGRSSIAGADTRLTLTVSLTFKPSFQGVKGIFLYAIDSAGQTTPTREQRGSWTVSTAVPTGAK